MAAKKFHFRKGTDAQRAFEVSNWMAGCLEAQTTGKPFSVETGLAAIAVLVANYLVCSNDRLGKNMDATLHEFDEAMSVALVIARSVKTNKTVPHNFEVNPKFD